MVSRASADTVVLTALSDFSASLFGLVVCRPLEDRGVRSGYSINTDADGSLNITGKL